MKMTRSLTLRASWKNGRGGRANRRRSWGELESEGGMRKEKREEEKGIRNKDGYD